MRRYFLLITALIPLFSIFAEAQDRMTMEQAIYRARTESVQALKARSSFVSSYWAWRSYVASRLPSLTAYGRIGSLNRSLTLLQNYETGEMVYTGTSNMQNSLGLSVRQVIPLTGGTVSLYSDLSRIDQFGANRSLTWYAQPVTLSYTQPVFSFNQYKWDEKISPKEYEKAKRTYLESMEDVTSHAVQYYFSLLQAGLSLEIARSGYSNTLKMLGVAKERVKLGGITRDEYLQLELKSLNDSISVRDRELSLREAQMSFCSFLALDSDSGVMPVMEEDIPDILVDYDMVLAKSMENSSFTVGSDISILNAEQAVAQARAGRGLSMTISARFGLSNSAHDFPATMNNLLDQEVVGVTFSIPIYDWGMGRGRVKKAEASAEVVRAQVLQAENDYRRSLFTAVGQFNNQRQQCMVSQRAAGIARERYSLIMDKFAAGKATVLELKNAQEESDAAALRHVQNIRDYWNYYFTLRQLTLYDFIEGRDLDVDYTEMI